MSTTPIVSTSSRSKESPSAQNSVQHNLDAFLKKDVRSLINEGINDDVIKTIYNKIEKETNLFNFTTLANVQIQGTNLDLFKYLQLLSVKNFVFFDAPLLELTLLKLQLHLENFDSEQNPDSNLLQLANKLSDVMITKIVDLHKTTSSSFIIHYKDLINIAGNKPKLFCHFHSNQWHVCVFYEPPLLEAQTPIFHGSLNRAYCQGILFNRKGEVIIQPQLLIELHRLNNQDAHMANIVSEVCLSKQLKTAYVNTDALTGIIEGAQQKHWGIKVTFYLPWTIDLSDKANYFLFEGIFNPKTDQIVDFTSSSTKRDFSTPAFPFNLPGQGGLKGREHLEIVEILSAEENVQFVLSSCRTLLMDAFTSSPDSTQQIATDLRLWEASGFENEIQQIGDKELLELQCAVLTEIVSLEKENPGSCSEAIIAIAEEQKTPIVDEIAPIDLANMMLKEKKEALETVQDQEHIPTISPLLMQKDKEVRQQIEQSSQPLSTKEKQKLKKKQQKQRKKEKEAALNKMESGKQEILPSAVNNNANSAPHLRKKDEKMLEAMRLGKAVKSRILFKLAMKMVDGVKNVKGSHFNGNVSQSDGSSVGTTILKKHGAFKDSSVSAVSAKKTIQKLFALRGKK